MKLSEWIDDDHASFRYISGTDPEDIANRVAFIEKTPRVRIASLPTGLSFVETMFADSGNWQNGPKGDGHLCGHYQPSRDWCDARLIEMGYELP